ncbi:MAG: DASS family sodium-coupled anion symporter [Deltaproteobacteria bacterium]|nr:DASS family sodium-coupled anion symporter [Deltaproteobacteria bacterium]
MSEPSPPRYERRQWIGLFLGLGVFFLCLLLPPPAGMETQAWRMAAATALMAVWWVSEAVHPSVTALVPLALFPFLHILTPQEVSEAYADHVIFLFLGGFIIALAIEKCHLHHRLALQVLNRVGASPQSLTLGIMVTTAAISMWVSNVATTLIMLPIALAILDHAESQGYDTKKGFGTALMLMIAYAASIGGVGTPVGTPPNVIFLGAFTKLFPDAPTIGFLQWMLFGVPAAALLTVITWAYLTYISFPYPAAGWQADKQFLRTRLQALGPMSSEEKKVALIGAITALLWIFRAKLPLGSFTIPGWSQLLPPPVTIQDSTVAMVMALLLFFIPTKRKSGKFLMDWETAERLPWGVLILLGGGLALAEGVEKTGLASWLGGQLSSLGQLSPLSVIFSVTLLTAWVTEFASNTATTTLIMPILAATAQALQMDPLLLMIPATFAASVCNFMLPSATGPNAIVFTSGHVTVPQMVRAGIGLDIIGAVILTILVYLVGIFVFGISLDTLPPWAR